MKRMIMTKKSKLILNKVGFSKKRKNFNRKKRKNNENKRKIYCGASEKR